MKPASANGSLYLYQHQPLFCMEGEGYLHHDSAAVTDGLAETAQAKGNHVCPCLITNALHNLDNEADGEEGGEESVGAKRGVVTIKSTFNGTLNLLTVPVNGLANFGTCPWIRGWNGHGEGCLGWSVRGIRVGRRAVEIL